MLLGSGLTIRRAQVRVTDRLVVCLEVFFFSSYLLFWARGCVLSLVFLNDWLPVRMDGLVFLFFSLHFSFFIFYLLFLLCFSCCGSCVMIGRVPQNRVVVSPFRYPAFRLVTVV